MTEEGKVLSISEKTWTGAKEAQVLTSCVNSGTSLNLSVPRFPNQQNGSTNMEPTCEPSPPTVQAGFFTYVHEHLWSMAKRNAWLWQA